MSDWQDCLSASLLSCVWSIWPAFLQQPCPHFNRRVI